MLQKNPKNYKFPVFFFQHVWNNNNNNNNKKPETKY